MQTTSMNNPAASAKADYHRRKREHQRLNVPVFIASLEGVKTPEQILLECEQAERLDRLIDQLRPPRAGLAVRYYYGIRCEPGTLEQVSQKFGVTRERIRQILNKAVRQLRRWMLKADDRKRYLKTLDQEIAERRTNERRLEDNLEQEKVLAEQARLAWEEQYITAEEREFRAKQLRQLLAEQEAKQRAWEKRRAQQEFDWAYVEAHRVNALWEFELERRADERRLQAKMAERRLQEEQCFEFERIRQAKIEARIDARLEREAKRRAEKTWTEQDWLEWEEYREARLRKRKVKVKRNWLLVGSK